MSFQKIQTEGQVSPLQKEKETLVINHKKEKDFFTPAPQKTDAVAACETQTGIESLIGAKFQVNKLMKEIKKLENDSISKKIEKLENDAISKKLTSKRLCWED